MAQYTVTDLKRTYKTLKEAKAAFNLKAKSWAALAEKLNAPTYEELQAKVKYLSETIKLVQKENDILKQSVSKTEEFDEIGFWLLDNNFDRSRFSDFKVPEQAFLLESVAKQFYKSLATRYHPDNGGTEMQMKNVGNLHNQIMALVDMNGGIGK